MARVLHSDDRAFANFQPAELVKLCGVAAMRWPLYALKELMDNAAAAMEEHGANPMMKVIIEESSITVEDSCDGITDSVLNAVLDFSKFGGSNRHHKLPTRGAQGNALMTIIGIATSWGTTIHIGRRGSDDVIELVVNVDQVRQTVEPVINVVSTGVQRSFIRVGMPPLPIRRGGTTLQDLEALAHYFALINPSISFAITKADGTRYSVTAERGNKAIMPPVPCGAASWFSVDDFADRLAADVRARPDTQLSHWASEFLGAKSPVMPMGSIELRAPQERQALTAIASMWRARIISSGSSVDDPAFEKVGQERMGKLLLSCGADANSPVEYESVSGVFERGEARIPFTAEVAFRLMPDGSKHAPAPMFFMNRTLLYGSPTFDGLKVREKIRGPWKEGLSGELSTLTYRYGTDSGKYPGVLVVHVVCPSPGYSGYGKQTFDTRWLATPLSEAVEKVTLNQRKLVYGEAKRKSTGPVHDKTIRAKMFEMLPATLDRDTEGGKLPILLRQLYYGFRKDWYTRDSRELEYQTFCVYVGEYEEHLGREVCLKDPRGTMFEPHSGRVVQLGTAQVRDFSPKQWEGHTIIFLEKENLAHLLRNLKIGKRWDAIIVGAKGFAVHAIRDVLQKYKQLLGSQVKIICLHDADPAGYLIGHDLRTNLPRFGDNVDLQLIDVGLTVREAREMDLQDEPFPLIRVRDGVPQLQEWSKVNNMRNIRYFDHNGDRRFLLEPEALDAFMPAMVRSADKPDWVKTQVNGRRIELNAMAPRQFGEWVERKLEQHGCRKVRPPDSIVDERLRHSRETLINRQMGEMFMRMLGDEARMEVMAELGVPAYDLDAVLAGRPEQHWTYLVDRAGQGDEDRVSRAVERVLSRRMPGVFNASR